MANVFQGVVGVTIAAGVLGELAFSGPTRAQPVRFSADNANNQVARVVTIVDGATASFELGGDIANPKALDVAVGGTGAFAGIIVNPKSHVLYNYFQNGQMVFPKGTIAEALTMGSVWCECDGEANPGDAVGYNTTTGAIVIVPDPETPGAGVALIDNAEVEYYKSAADNLGVIKLTR